MTVKNFLFFQSSAASSLGALRLFNAVQSALHQYIPADRSETAGPTETTARPRLQVVLGFLPSKQTITLILRREGS